MKKINDFLTRISLRMTPRNAFMFSEAFQPVYEIELGYNATVSFDV